MSQALDELSREAYAQPYGRTRSALLEQVVERADAEGEIERAFSARIDLCVAYGQSGEPRLRFAPFARCLADLDAEPDRFGGFRHRLLWAYKGVVESMTRFPEIPLDSTVAALDDMERRWLAAGQSLHAVHQHRWHVAHHVGDTETAAEAFRAWSTAPRDSLSDCAGCDPNDKVRHLRAVGRDAEAVELGLATLEQRLGCVEQPHAMQTTLLPSLVALGRLGEARDLHLRAYRAVRTMPAEMGKHTAHLRFATSTGNLDRARQILERHVVGLLDPPDPFSAMDLQAVGARLLTELSSTRPGSVVRDEQGLPTDAAALAERYATAARALADRFDARNETTHQGERVEHLLVEERWVDHLPLLLPLASPEAAAVEAETAVPAASGEHEPEPERQPSPEPDATAVPEPPEPAAVLPDPDAVGVDDLLGLVDDALDEGRLDVVRAATERFETERPSGEQTALERGRVAVARAALAEEDEDPAAATEALRDALVHLDEAGDERRLQRTRALLGLTLVQRGEVEEATATADAALAWLVEHDEEDRRFGWAFRRLQLDRAADRSERVYDSLRDLFAQHGTNLARAQYVALLLAQEELARGRYAEAEGAATRATTATDPEWWRWARRFRADARRAQGDADGAVEDRLEALAGSPDDPVVPDAAGDPVLVLDLGDDYLAAERDSEAAEAGEVALQLLGGAARPDVVERARLLLLNAYRRLGLSSLALEQVEALEEDVTDETPLRWRAQLLGERGSLLLAMDRGSEARTPLLAAAEAYGAADDLGGRVRSLRQAFASALGSGDHAVAAEIWEDAFATADRLPDEAERWFHTGWLWLERADLDVRTDRHGEAATAFETAESTFHRGGFGDYATEAVLRRAERLGSDVDALRSLFVGAAAGSNAWFRSGWLLADQLRELGRAVEADALEAELEAAAGQAG